MSLRSHAIEIFNAAIKAVQPATVLPAYIQTESKSLVVAGEKYNIENGVKIFTIAIGKAAGAMTNVIQEMLGNTIAQSLVITKKDHAAEVKNSIVLEAGHPVPDDKSVAASLALLHFLNHITSNDIVLFFISGGASSLVTDVPGQLTLRDIQDTQKMLLRCGADIKEINSVRKHLSNLKGGQLLRHCNGATVLSFIISDVAGNDISVIGSGLTAPDNSNFADAMEVMQHYNLLKNAPPAVIKYLQQGKKALLPETLKTGNALFDKVKNIIVADNAMALKQAAVKATDLGYHVAFINDAMFGNTEVEANSFVQVIKNYNGQKPACFIAGGETVIEVKGNGKGGRNQHFALTVLNILLHQQDKGVAFPLILSAGTDGTDGPTDAAGAITDTTIIEQVREENIPVEEYLCNNDAWHFFKRTNGLLITGPTQTNVMDIVIALLP